MTGIVLGVSTYSEAIYFPPFLSFQQAPRSQLAAVAEKRPVASKPSVKKWRNRSRALCSAWIPKLMMNYWRHRTFNYPLVYIRQLLRCYIRMVMYRECFYTHRYGYSAASLLAAFHGGISPSLSIPIPIYIYTNCGGCNHWAAAGLSQVYRGM